MDIVERLDNVDVFAHGEMEDLFEDASVEIGRLRFENAKMHIQFEILKDAVVEYVRSVIEAEGVTFLDRMETPYLRKAIIKVLDERDPDREDK